MRVRSAHRRDRAAGLFNGITASNNLDPAYAFANRSFVELIREVENRMCGRDAPSFILRKRCRSSILPSVPSALRGIDLRQPLPRDGTYRSVA
jgi:hypothetical protein